ncbi:cytidine deaminase [bacterium]|nr:cytidine deaminase [bacterium]
MQAKKVSENAYAKYSKFKVGACVLYESGNTYIGCNVENGSYGLCLCAERNAISTAIASGEKSNLLSVAIYSPNTKLCWPCGACRQWFSEFENGQNIKVVLENKNGEAVEFSIDEIMPHRFELIP